MITGAFSEDGFMTVPHALQPGQRPTMLDAARRLLTTSITRGRDRGADGKDGFRGILDLDDAFLSLLDNPAVLPIVVGLLSPNIQLISSHLIALPSVPAGAPRAIRTPQRPGWHRDLYGVTDDLGFGNTPRLAVKCAYYLSDIGEDTGTTTFLPGSHLHTGPPAIPSGAIDPPGPFTPHIGPDDAILFENRTWHAGGLNTSGTPRIAVMMQYGYRWLALVDDLPERLLGRTDLTPVQRQLLGAPDRADDGSLSKGSGSQPLRQWLRQLGEARR